MQLLRSGPHRAIELMSAVADGVGFKSAVARQAGAAKVAYLIVQRLRLQPLQQQALLGKVPAMICVPSPRALHV